MLFGIFSFKVIYDILLLSNSLTRWGYLPKVSMSPCLNGTRDLDQIWLLRHHAPTKLGAAIHSI